MPFQFGPGSMLEGRMLIVFAGLEGLNPQRWANLRRACTSHAGGNGKLRPEGVSRLNLKGMLYVQKNLPGSERRRSPIHSPVCNVYALRAGSKQLKTQF